MKIDNSNKKYSIIIAGILVISVFSIFIALLIGFGDNSIFKQDRVQFAYNETLSTSFNADKVARKERIVPVAKCDCFGPYQTLPGSIKYTIYIWDDSANDYVETFSDTTMPAPGDFTMPLCFRDTIDMEPKLIADGIPIHYDDPLSIDNDLDLAGWYIKAEVVGGYTHLQSYLKIIQEKYGIKDWSTVQYIDIDWDDGLKDQTPGSCATIYYGVFDVDDGLDIDVDNADGDDDISTGVDDGSGMILLEASFAPNGQDLSKKYDICFKSKWEGCGQPDQDFWLILEHY